MDDARPNLWGAAHCAPKGHFRSMDGSKIGGPPRSESAGDSESARRLKPCEDYRVVRRFRDKRPEKEQASTSTSTGKDAARPRDRKPRDLTTIAQSSCSRSNRISERTDRMAPAADSLECTRQSALRPGYAAGPGSVPGGLRRRRPGDARGDSRTRAPRSPDQARRPGLCEARIDLSGFADGPRRRTAGAKRKTTSEHSRTFADNAFAAASKRSARDRSGRRPRAPPEGAGDAEPPGRPIVGKAAWKGSAKRAMRSGRAGVSRRTAAGPSPPVRRPPEPPREPGRGRWPSRS